MAGKFSRSALSGFDPSRGIISGFTPRSLGSGLKLWLRGDMGTSTTVNGAPVSAWTDSAPSPIASQSQAVPASQPLFNSADVNLNGRPSIVLDGANDTMASAAFGVAIPQPVTWMIVAYSNNIAAAQRQAIEGVGANRHFISQNGAGDIFAGAANSITTSPAVTWINQKRIVIFEANGAASAIYVNGFTVPNVTGNAGALSVTGLRLGSFNGSSNFWSGSIGEVVMCTGASLSIRRSLAQYAGGRYAIPVT